MLDPENKEGSLLVENPMEMIKKNTLNIRLIIGDALPGLGS
jgi:hypothetical protein